LFTPHKLVEEVIFDVATVEEAIVVASALDAGAIQRTLVEIVAAIVCARIRALVTGYRNLVLGRATRVQIDDVDADCTGGRCCCGGQSGERRIVFRNRNRGRDGIRRGGHFIRFATDPGRCRSDNAHATERNLDVEAQIGSGGNTQAVVENRCGVGIGGWHGAEGADNRTIPGAVFGADHVLKLKQASPLSSQLVIVVTVDIAVVYGAAAP